MEADMQIADQNHQWFKFLLIHEGGSYKPLDHEIYVTQKFIMKDEKGKNKHSKIITRQTPLNYRVESHFKSEYLYGPNPLFHGSNIERCFRDLLYNPPEFAEQPPYMEDSQFYYDSDEDGMLGCTCGGIYIDGYRDCTCFQGRDGYD